ncbi:MAG TPA: hypothetical protein VIQ30_25210 [Pseudonocardia sp.]
MTTPPAGEPPANALETDLADLVGTDGSLWTYQAHAGGYVSEQHPDVIACEAAAVAAHTGGEDAPVWQARPEDYPPDTQETE